jgi:hypothetical protein
VIRRFLLEWAVRARGVVCGAAHSGHRSW